MSNYEIAQQFELASLSDLIRLLVSRIDRANRAGYIYYAEIDGKHTFVTSQVVPGWYNLRGLPMTVKVVGDDPGNSNFIQYKFATDNDEESWTFTSNISNDPKVAHIPLIRVKEFPDYLI